MIERLLDGFQWIWLIQSSDVEPQPSTERVAPFCKAEEWLGEKRFLTSDKFQDAVKIHLRVTGDSVSRRRYWQACPWVLQMPRYQWWLWWKVTRRVTFGSNKFIFYYSHYFFYTLSEVEKKWPSSWCTTLYPLKVLYYLSIL